MSQWVVAITARSTLADGLQHAISLPPQRYSRTGKTYVAMCGAQVARIYDGTLWDRLHPRACRNCKQVLDA